MPTDKEEHAVIIEKQDEILKILNGNGKIGLCAKVNILWSITSLIIITSSVALIKAFWVN